MLQVYKILHGKDKVTTTIKLLGARATRLVADPMNVKVPMARLDTRKHFFTGRTPNPWNATPADTGIKQARTTASFKHLFRMYRSTALAAARGM